jgi:glycosyltransferase involved in cell wall biosynthesis
VAFVIGTLEQDGAEKQLVYMVRCLREANVDVRAYCLTRGEYYEEALLALGVKPYWVGRFGNRFARGLAVAKAVREFRPHIVQASHFWTNLYATAAARVCKAMAIGCCRNDVFSEIADCKRLGPWSLRLPDALVVNSRAAKRNAKSRGADSDRIHVLSNVLDVEDFDARQDLDLPMPLQGPPLALGIGRLVAQKRFDRFLTALAQARRALPALKGLLVGEGPDRCALERHGAALGLFPDHIAFLGRRRDVPALLRRADMLVVSSDHEGFPNVVLEAMAARKPVITTPVGDAANIVEDGITGYVVPFDGEEMMAERMAQIAESPELRRRLGENGRRRLEQRYSYGVLAQNLFALYRGIAEHQQRRDLLRILPKGDFAFNQEDQQELQESLQGAANGLCEREGP